MHLSRPIESLVPGLRGRVLTVLVRSARPVGVRELARRAGTTSHSSVKAIVDSLMSDGMVRIALVSKPAVFYELNREHLLVRHLTEIDNARQQVLDLVAGAAASWEPAPLAVVLFGSVARWEDTALSDIDVLMVVDDEDSNFKQSAALSDEVYALTGNSLNFLVLTGQEWKDAVSRGDTIVSEVAVDGRELFGMRVRQLVRLGA